MLLNTSHSLWLVSESGKQYVFGEETGFEKPKAFSTRLWRI